MSRDGEGVSATQSRGRTNFLFDGRRTLLRGRDGEARLVPVIVMRRARGVL